MVCGVATYSGVAGAEPQPSLNQVQAEVNALTAKLDQAVQRYDQAAEQLHTAQARLSLVNKEVARDQKRFQAARQKVARLAAAAYEDAGKTSVVGLLTSGNPTQVLNESSLVLQLTGNSNEETKMFLAAAQQLSSVQQEQQHTEYGIAALATQRLRTKQSIQKLYDNEKATLDSLTVAQQQQVTNVGSNGSSTQQTYNGPTGTQADTAVAFAYNAVGRCPYLYGGTSCYPGYDCSGLVQAAWAAARIQIPRDTYSQWAALPHVSESAMQPGDLMFFDGIGHVGMYVGGGELIDAPIPGQYVQKVAFSGWYAANFDGAARP